MALKEFRRGIKAKAGGVRRFGTSSTGSREKVQPLAHLYKTQRWRDLVVRIRARDLMVCQATGIQLFEGIYPDPASPVVDHRVPHDGDEALFWDEENLWLVSKGWHDGQKQREDRARERGLMA